MRSSNARAALLLYVGATCCCLLPTLAWAQGTSGIAGLVRDSSGGVLPGVTVEAASPALIERVRTVTTDEKGEYKIVDLPGGIYSVSFSLTGFATVKREGLELTANFTANVTAELRVGGIEETVLVSGQTPIVDVQTTAEHKVVSGDLLYSLPLTKEMGGFAKVTVGATIAATAQDVGGNIDPMNGYTLIHGGHYQDNRALLDGMQFNGEGQGRGFYFNPAAASEVSVQLGGQTAEFENGGVQANLVPKDGGNKFSGLFSFNGSNHSLISNNLTPDLEARGLHAVNTTDRTYDGSAAIGGPVRQDRLWFFASFRTFGYKNLMASDYYNLTQNTPFYTPDTSNPAPQQQDNVSGGVRLTYQVAAKDKINFSYDIQHTNLCLGCSPLVAPEATYITHYANPNYLLQAKWTHLANTKLLWELADSTLIFNWPNTRASNAPGVSILNGNTGFRYNAPLASSLGERVASESNQRGSVSYVTGTHAFKVGFTTQEAWHHAWYDDGGPAPGIGAGLVSYTFFNGLPSSITEYAEPVTFSERLKVNLGLYAQDQWTMKRLTLNMGLRFDYFNAFVPPQDLAAGPFVPARHYDQVDCVPCWKDINPRLAAAYDLFGNGKTALKFNVGRFVQADIYTEARANNPVTRAILSATRTWTDLNGNFTPDCNLANPNAQDSSATGGDVCGKL
ncbi:MAG TPA: TonB-dependent receptor, partial [Vicinamibacterales bacterium]|nr:TonB-dependent receptor [Vicinamibacterales bacterium]